MKKQQHKDVPYSGKFYKKLPVTYSQQLPHRRRTQLLQTVHTTSLVV